MVLFLGSSERILPMSLLLPVSPWPLHAVCYKVFLGCQVSFLVIMEEV